MRYWGEDSMDCLAVGMVAMALDIQDRGVSGVNAYAV